MIATVERRGVEKNNNNNPHVAKSLNRPVNLLLKADNVDMPSKLDADDLQ
jgi:hypothetical protein